MHEYTMTMFASLMDILQQTRFAPAQGNPKHVKGKHAKPYLKAARKASLWGQSLSKTKTSAFKQLWPAL